MIKVNVSEDGETISFGSKRIKKEIYGFSITGPNGITSLTHEQMSAFIHFANHFGTTAVEHDYDAENPEEIYKGRG